MISPPACNEAHAGCEVPSAPAPCEAQQRCATALRVRPEKLEGKELLCAAIAAAQSCGCCAARATASANFAAAVPLCAHLHATPQPSLTPCLQFSGYCLVFFRPEMQKKSCPPHWCEQGETVSPTYRTYLGIHVLLDPAQNNITT